MPESLAVAGEVPLHGLEVFGMLFEITNASWDFEIVGHVGDGSSTRLIVRARASLQ